MKACLVVSKGGRDEKDSTRLVEAGSGLQKNSERCDLTHIARLIRPVPTSCNDLAVPNKDASDWDF